MSEQTPILSIRMTPAGLDLVIATLRKLPHDQVDALVRELVEQGQQEMSRILAEQAPESDAPVDPT